MSRSGLTHQPQARERLSPLWGWLVLILLPALVIFMLPDDVPAWGVMWTLAFAIFAGCKTIALAGLEKQRLLSRRTLGFFLLWPGMDSRAFFAEPAACSLCKPCLHEWALAGLKTIIGLVIVFGLSRFVPADWPYLSGWAGMIGTVTALHFGLFHLMSCGWRAAGVDARLIMDRPGASTSLGEFWGRRWNTAFRDLAHRFVFAPMIRKVGPLRGLWAGFLVSGLVHDLVISYPVNSGWGMPTLYFLIQAGGLTIEKSAAGRRLGLGHGVRGWLFTFAVLIAPVGLLFHRAFVEEVFLGFMKAIGAIP